MPSFHMIHSLRDDLRDSYLEASNPWVKMSANCLLVDMCRRLMILSSTKLLM